MAAAAVASASFQLPEKSSTPLPSRPNLLASSPYLDESHLLDLNTLDPQSRLLAIALTSLRTRTPDYATVKYEDSLDLDGLLGELQVLVARAGIQWQSQSFYVVEFRSQLKAVIDNPLLFKLDIESHKEANISGGLLKYWYGEPDADRNNLATCFWTSKEAAIAGGKGPLHKQARAIIPHMYESIHVKGLLFTVADGAKGWTLGPYS